MFVRSSIPLAFALMLGGPGCEPVGDGCADRSVVVGYQVY